MTPITALRSPPAANPASGACIAAMLAGIPVKERLRI